MSAMHNTGVPKTPSHLRQECVVVGAGYVGLVTAACLAAMGNHVVCVDADAGRVHRLRMGVLPFHEPGLAELVQGATTAGRLRFATSAAEAATHADIAFVAVGTLDADGHWTDRNVSAAIDDLLALPEVPPLLVVRSTLRPGRMGQFSDRVVASGRATTLLVQPEFTKESTAVADFLAPDRVVIGIPAGTDPSVADRLRQLYEPLGSPFLIVDHASAELIKIGSNAFLAVKISFANELARLCREVGADAADVRRGLGLDPRIGEQFLRAGPGFGGSCLPSQVELLTALSDELDLDLELLPAVHRANHRQAARIASEVVADLGPDAKVAVLGLAFKAGTDDVRESPALGILRALREQDVRRLAAFDPAVPALRGEHGIEVCTTPYAAAAGADAVIIATEWPIFASLDWTHLARVMARHEAYDARAVVDVAAAAAAGFRVRSVERAPTMPVRVAPSPSNRPAPVRTLA
jgi:UDPglucose 6-dehydrogenase